MATDSAKACPRCGAPANGNFCATCGAPLGEHPCASCGAVLSAGAKFCHKCGASSTLPTSTSASASHAATGITSVSGQRVPWIVAGVLAVIAITAVVYSANRRGEVTAPAMANAGNAGAGGTVAPDISNMTPKEQFSRLVDRVTAAAERGDTAMVTRFWPMASGAYQNLLAADRDADARFHMGWLHLFAAQYPEVKALADTIMAASPDHLFGYYLRASVAQAQGDLVGARAASKAFRANFAVEMARTNRPEYAQHRAMLEKFRDAASAP